MSASKFHAVRVRQPLRKPVAPPNGYTQAGGVSSALMVKSDLLASGGRVGGPAGAIQVIPNRFGRSASSGFAGYAEAAAAPATAPATAPTIEYAEVGPGDKGDVVKEAAKLVVAKVKSIKEADYQTFDTSRPRHNAAPSKGPINKVDVSHIMAAVNDGVYTPEFSLQVGILQKYMNEKENNKAVGVTGVVDEPTWRALGVPTPTVIKKKPKPASTGGGYTPVKGQGDATPPATPLWQKPWFMPAAIGVGVLGVVGAIIFWPSKKAEQ